MAKNFYNEIKDEFINYEVYKKVKNHSVNRKELDTYYNVGKLLIEAQGGEERAKYGNTVIEEYSKKLTEELGKGYDTTTLKRCRQFYLLIQKGAPLGHQLTWSHYRELLPIKNINEISYYIQQCTEFNLSKRALIEKIKNHEYQRLDDKTKNKLITKEETTITDFVKNPLIIKSHGKEIVSEKILKALILENLDDFLKELGPSFSYIANEYKIIIGNRPYYIDILLFNIKYNSYVVVELKNAELKHKDLGQIQVYMNYIDENLKSINQNKTIGIIICKEDNKFLIKYCSDSRIFATKYILI